MELKVYVEGVPRVVCGVTTETTCQEVVTALAQALSQPGRYMLRERFKEFERCMKPNECILETLNKYGEQARDVQLTLLHSGPPAWDEMSRAKVGRHQPCPPLRRKEASSKTRRGSGSISLQRQSLPPLSCSRRDGEQPREDMKRPKRKSLTLMEEAWEWLESLGKGSVYSTAGDKERGKKTDKKSRSFLSLTLSIERESSGSSKDRGQKSSNSDLEPQTSCCMQKRIKEGRHSTNSRGGKSDNLANSTNEDEKYLLRETIACQLSYLQDLQSRITCVDKEILELEQQQRARKLENEEQLRMTEDDLEQIELLENELKAEESYEKDLQRQFLEMRMMAADCKAKLEECRCQVQGPKFFRAESLPQDDIEIISNVGIKEANEISTGLEDQNQEHEEPIVDPYPPNQIKRRPTGPTELREWWTRWAEANSFKSKAKKKEIHRTELTIYLSSTKV